MDMDLIARMSQKADETLSLIQRLLEEMARLTPEQLQERKADYSRRFEDLTKRLGEIGQELILTSAQPGARRDQ